MRRFVVLMTLAGLLSSCATVRSLTYIRDAEEDVAYPVQPVDDLIVHPGDRLDIKVYATEPALAAPFNVMSGLFSVSSESSSSNGDTDSGSSSSAKGYLVDNNGDIDFPILGTLHVAGLTLDAIKTQLRAVIVSRGYIQEPIVTVDLLNFKIVVLGDANGPQLVSTTDRMNLFELISKVNDLTLYANRSKVLVVRKEGDYRRVYRVDLASMDVFDSPAFNLHQNDIVYFTPRRTKATSDSEYRYRLAEFIFTHGLTALSIWAWFR